MPCRLSRRAEVKVSLLRSHLDNVVIPGELLLVATCLPQWSLPVVAWPQEHRPSEETQAVLGAYVECTCRRRA